MTGFGSAVADSAALRASVTVRSVNHRFLDVSVHLPRRLQALEPEVKRRVSGQTTRGRVDVSVSAAVRAEGAPVQLADAPVVAGVVEALRRLKADHALAGEVTVTDVARFPGIVEVAEAPAAVDGAQATAILGMVDEALTAMNGMRRAEGHALREALAAALEAIARASDRITTLSEEARAARREALLARVRELMAGLGADDGRLYQEVARLVEKADVAEEVDRLKSHVVQAKEALASGVPCGKRLDFLAQEMGREANTIGSKAASAPLVHEVVALKGEIERLREQVQNVE
jgi:uncharacterized protein (TIGR00255 family)